MKDWFEIFKIFLVGGTAGLAAVAVIGVGVGAVIIIIQAVL